MDAMKRRPDDSNMLDQDGKIRHDLTNQLGIVLGFTDIPLATTPVDDQRHADLRQIYSAATAALEQIRRLDRSGRGENL